ncbi:MAG: hypothetical protein PUC18_12765 [Prevotellaceae bacterium]|nr:hypothetical protein [Prevotellaceae bacterium]
MNEEGLFYTVAQDLSRAPLRDHLMHGYEERSDFERALRQLIKKWENRVGECVGGRHGFLLLRFHDTPGGRPDEAWLPLYLLQETEPPERKKKTREEIELDEAFGFD